MLAGSDREGLRHLRGLLYWHLSGRIDVGIRGRLLALTMGVAIPLAVTGLGLALQRAVSRERIDLS